MGRKKKERKEGRLNSVNCGPILVMLVDSAYDLLLLYIMLSREKEDISNWTVTSEN